MKNNLNKKNNSITKSKKTSYKKKSKKTSLKRIINKNISFPQGENFKCITPCFPSNTTFYHPITLYGLNNNYDSCGIQILKENNFRDHDKCIYDPTFNFENYDVFSDFFQLASNDKLFLEQIYNIYSLEDVELFLNNSLIELPTLSQKRILNTIYKVYRDNDSFPNEHFAKNIKEILFKKYNIDIKTKKIINKLIKNKYKHFWNDIFMKFYEKNK